MSQHAGDALPRLQDRLQTAAPVGPAPSMGTRTDTLSVSATSFESYEDGQTMIGVQEAPGGASAIQTVPEAVDDPHRLASLFLERECAHTGLTTLRFWRGEYHRWDAMRGAYAEIAEGELRAELTAAIKSEFDHACLSEQEQPSRPGKKQVARMVTKGVVSNTLQALQGLTLLTGSIDQPSWIGGERPYPPEKILPARNQLIHLPSLISGWPNVLTPTPDFFSGFALDYDFDPNAAEPREWLAFLSDLWEDDQQSIDALQEWMGYFLTPDTSQQKILFLVGPSRGGKGTIARVIRAMVGESNFAGPTLSSLATGFGLAPLIGKPVAIISDARLSGRADQAVIVERLLSISGKDSLTIDRKHRTAWTGKLPTRLVIISNELPRLNDASGALTGRLILLRLTRSFRGGEDTGLTGRLLAELPGILLWSVQGWRRLQDRGCFLQPKSAEQMVQQMEDLASPIAAFLRECCVVRPGAQVTVEDLFDRWARWCEDNARDHTGTTASFGRDLHAAIPGLTTMQSRRYGRVVRVFVGVGLAAEAADSTEAVTGCHG